MLSISLGCVSAADMDDTNSTIVSIDENSQNNEITNDHSQKEILKTDNNQDVLGDSELSITDSSTVYTKNDNVNIKIKSLASEDADVSVYLNGNSFETVKYKVISSGYAIPAIHGKTGTNTIYCVVPSIFGDEQSNTVTFTLIGNGSDTPSGDGTVTISIYDLNNPSQPTITSYGDYVADIAYKITKSGDGFSDENLDVIVNGQSVGSVSPNNSNRLGNLTINEDNEWVVQIVYTAAYNGKTVTATSNQLTFITRNTSGGNPSNTSANATTEKASATITIYDAGYPSNTTIFSNGDYKANIYSKISKSHKGFTDESLTVYVNDVMVGVVDLNSAGAIGSLNISEDNEWDVYVVYTATYNDETVTAVSNHLKFITKNTSGGNSTNSSTNTTVPEKVNVSVSIYDGKYPSNSTIISTGEYVASIYSRLSKSGEGFTDESLTVYVNDNVKETVYLNSTKGISSISIPENNEYDIYVVYRGTCNNENVTAVSNHLKYITKSTGVTPEPQPGEILFIIRDANYPESTEITLKDKYNALIQYYITVPESDLIVNNIIIRCNGESVTTFDNPRDKSYTGIGGTILINETGDYVFSAEYEYYIFMGEHSKVTSNTITYHVTITNETEEVAPEVSISIADVTYPNNATATVKSNVDGLYDVIIGENSYEVNVKNGIGCVSFALSADTYTATVVSKSNSSLRNSTTFKVNPKAKTLPTIISLEEINANSATISVTLPNDIGNEKITVKINNNGKTIEADIVNGNARVTFTGLAVSDYSYTVSYKGNENYTENSITRSFTIETSEAPVVKDTLKVTVSDVVYPACPKALIVSSQDGEFSLTIGENSYDITVTNGIASAELPVLTAGTYTVNILSKTNSSFTNSTTFNVKVDVKEDESLDVNTGDNSNSSTFSIDLPSDATGTLTVNVDGKTHTKELENGKASITVDDLENGEHNVVVTYSGDDKYSSFSKTKVIVINKKSDENQTVYDGATIVAEDLTRGLKSPFDFKATFYDTDGNPLQNTEVLFIVNGNDYPVITDEYGVAKLVGQLDVGTYEISMLNPASGDKLIKNATIVKRITGNKKVTVYYSYKFTYKLQIFADNAKAVGAGEKVTVKLNKKTYTAYTDKEGYVTFKIKNNKLVPKTYTITAEYKGVKVSGKVAVKQILKSKNIKVKKSAKNKKFTATLKTSKGKAIKGKKITFKVKGKTYTAKTNKKGVATVKITNLKKVGKYKVTVKYLKNTVKKTITVKK